LDLPIQTERINQILVVKYGVQDNLQGIVSQRISHKSKDFYFFLDVVWLPNNIGRMDEQKRYKEFVHTFIRVVHKFHALEKLPRDFAVDQKLYPQEIHTIATIGESPDINVTKLAEKMEVTKGTISPIVTKLATKKLVTKFKGGDNNKEILLRLTMKGEVAYHAHEMFHSKLHSDLHSELLEEYGEITPKHLDFIKKFLRAGERLLDRYLKEKS